MNGHNLKPGGFAAALAVLIAVVLASCSPKGAVGGDAACGLSDADFRTEGILEAIPVRATFLDEVSWDIPHQNWGVREWDADFRAMKNMGINTVVLIRAGLGRWIAAPFECLLESEEVYYPPVDLVEMFLTLADKYGMAFYFGMYDSGKYWQEGLFRREIDLNLKLIDEVWARYGHHKSFQGWYLSQEISRRTKNMSRIYAEVGRHAKAVSGGLKTMISPYIHGIKTDQVMAGDKALSVEEHRREWNEILGNVAGAVDILVSGRAGRLPRVVRLSGGEQGAGRQIRHGVLDQHRVVRPRHADPLPADQMGETAAEAGRRTAGRDAERHHVRILALYESQFGLSAGGTSLRSLLRLF